MHVIIYCANNGRHEQLSGLIMIMHVTLSCFIWLRSRPQNVLAQKKTADLPRVLFDCRILSLLYVAWPYLDST